MFVARGCGRRMVCLAMSGLVTLGLSSPREAGADVVPGPRYVCQQVGTYNCYSPSFTCWGGDCNYTSSGCPASSFPVYQCQINNDAGATGCTPINDNCANYFWATLCTCNWICAATSDCYAAPCGGAWQSGCNLTYPPKPN